MKKMLRILLRVAKEGSQWNRREPGFKNGKKHHIEEPKREKIKEKLKNCKSLEIKTLNMMVEI